MTPEGFFFLKREEGFSSVPYRCSAGVWTIGYGATYLQDGVRVSASTPPITEDEASALLEDLVASFELVVRNTVKVPITPYQLDALTSFCYNIGKGAFRASTLVRKLNEEDYDAVGTQLLRWKHGGRGLIFRRQREKRLFEEGVYE